MVPLRDEDGNTMLIAAVRYSNLGAVKLILNVGEADVTLSNSKGATALHYAAAAGGSEQFFLWSTLHCGDKGSRRHNGRGRRRIYGS